MSFKHSQESLLEYLKKYSNSRLPNTHRVKLHLLQTKFLENKCSICNMLPFWFGKPISFHLDHIDGNPKNNEVSNFRILCPNCHSQTESYCGKKNTKTQHIRQKYFCLDCKSEITSRAKRCKSCARRA